VLTVWLVYRVTRALFDTATGLIAAFFLAVAYLHVRESHFGVTDVPMTCLVVAALLLFTRAAADPLSLRRWAVAGATAGLAASTKYNAGVVVAAGLWAAIAGVRAQPADWSARAAARAAAVLLGAAVVGFVAATPFAVLDVRAFLEGMRFNGHHLVSGHGIDLGYGWIYHAMFSLRYGLGAPLLIAGIAGMLILTVRSWRTAAFVCAFPVLYYLLLGRGLTVFVRYMVPMVPLLCITAAVAVVALTRSIPMRSSYARAFVTAAVAALIALPSIQRVVAFDRLLVRPDTRVLAASWLDAHGASEWIAETPDGIVHPIWGRSPAARIARFDAEHGRFVSDTGEVVSPEWIVVATSPLSVYTTVPAGLTAIVASSYSRMAAFAAATGVESPKLFDQQDKFFVPYTGFEARVRPGPDIEIYRRLPSRP
jgi:4-amino-4-deoxy-L-arabinose transferase-like glycosyltransferase